MTLFQIRNTAEMRAAAHPRLHFRVVRDVETTREASNDVVQYSSPPGAARVVISSAGGSRLPGDCEASPPGAGRHRHSKAEQIESSCVKLRKNFL